MQQRILSGYDDATLAAGFDAVDSVRVLAPVLHWLPRPSKSVLDVGAGTGRDARYLSALGHRVTAIEPARSLRQSNTASGAVLWRSSQLPKLVTVSGRFDLILCNAVWHHLPLQHRRAALWRFRSLLRANGRVILSLRHGPTSNKRPGYGAHVRQTVSLARRAGFRLRSCETHPSVQPRNQAAGVTWHWLVLDAPIPAAQRKKGRPSRDERPDS